MYTLARLVLGSSTEGHFPSTRPVPSPALERPRIAPAAPFDSVTLIAFVRPVRFFRSLSHRDPPLTPLFLLFRPRRVTRRFFPPPPVSPLLRYARKSTFAGFHVLCLLPSFLPLFLFGFPVLITPLLSTVVVTQWHWERHPLLFLAFDLHAAFYFPHRRRT